jgi:hypothetical protein
MVAKLGVPTSNLADPDAGFGIRTELTDTDTRDLMTKKLEITAEKLNLFGLIKLQFTYP